MPTTGKPSCRICQAGQRISTATFAFFAVALLMASFEPDQSVLRQGMLAVCAMLSGLAVFRFSIARLVDARRSGKRRASVRHTLQRLKDTP